MLRLTDRPTERVVAHPGSHSSKRRATRWTLALVVVATGALGCASGEAPDVAETEQDVAAPDAEGKVERLDVVDRAIAHHGGDVVERSSIGLTITSRSGSFDVLTKRRDGDTFEHEVRMVRDDIETVTFQDNTTVRRTIDGEEVTLSEEEASSALDHVSARVYFLFLPYRLNDPHTFKLDQGLETWGDRELRRVRVSFTPGTSTEADDEYLYWFDPSSNRLEQFAYSFSGGLRLRKLYNYREVGGVLFYDAENYAINEPGLDVGLIDESYAAANMELLSTIELSNIQVEDWT